MSNRRARRRLRNKRGGLQFPDTIEENSTDATDPNDSTSDHPTVTKAQKYLLKKKRTKLQNIVSWIFPCLALPYLLLDLRTTYTTMLSVAHLWISFTLLYFVFLYRDDAWNMLFGGKSERNERRSGTRTRTGTGGSNNRSGSNNNTSNPTNLARSSLRKTERMRTNQAGRASGNQKTSAEVVYERKLRQGAIQGPTNGKKISINEIQNMERSRGNVDGYFEALQYYRTKYETEKNAGKCLSEAQFRGLVQAVGVARSQLRRDVRLKEVVVSVERFWGEEENENNEKMTQMKVVEYQEVMTRAMFEAMNESKAK